MGGSVYTFCAEAEGSQIPNNMLPDRERESADVVQSCKVRIPFVITLQY